MSARGRGLFTFAHILGYATGRNFWATNVPCMPASRLYNISPQGGAVLWQFAFLCFHALQIMSTDILVHSYANLQMPCNAPFYEYLNADAGVSTCAWI